MSDEVITFLLVAGAVSFPSIVWILYAAMR